MGCTHRWGISPFQGCVGGLMMGRLAAPIAGVFRPFRAVWVGAGMSKGFTHRWLLSPFHGCVACMNWVAFRPEGAKYISIPCKRDVSAAIQPIALKGRNKLSSFEVGAQALCLLNATTREVLFAPSDISLALPASNSIQLHPLKIPHLPHNPGLAPSYIGARIFDGIGFRGG
jgi:hypothetical protein